MNWKISLSRWFPTRNIELGFRCVCRCGCHYAIRRVYITFRVTQNYEIILKGSNDYFRDIRVFLFCLSTNIPSFRMKPSVEIPFYASICYIHIYIYVEAHVIVLIISRGFAFEVFALICGDNTKKKSINESRFVYISTACDGRTAFKFIIILSVSRSAYPH